MIILDTNVVSEVIKPEPSPSVMRWFGTMPAPSLFITTLTQAEILYGVESLPSGRRRTRLREAVGQLFAEDFAGRILPFDSESARAFATIVSARDTAGRPISTFDAMIAAIALAHHAPVATRNVRDFDLCGLDIINPWSA